MSYEKIIGFGIDPKDPKAAPRTPFPKELSYFQKLGVEPIFIDLKAALPKKSKEPEPKIWLPRPSSFFDIRDAISTSANAKIIENQFYFDKKPLVSILTDTRKSGFPTAKLDRAHYSMRLRYEVDPSSGQSMQYDFNEKSAMATSQMIGGLHDRDEREYAFSLGTKFEEAYQQFIALYRHTGDPAFCDDISYSEHHVYGGYIAARSEYGFVVRHPVYPVAFVFEACEDVYDTYLYDMCQATQKNVCEFEFEPKQVWGQLPYFAKKSPEAFRAFLYSSMIDIRNHIAEVIPGAMINLKSKAENTKEHLEHHLPSGQISDMGLASYYQNRIPMGYTEHLTPLQSSLMMGHTIEKTLEEAAPHIAYRCSEMHYQKLMLNRDYEVPELGRIGRGSVIIGANDNRGTSYPALVAS